MQPDTMTRYQWIKFADGTVYGADNGPCTVEVTRVNKWNNMARNNGYGHYCLCTCNARRQERNVIRAISLMSQMADIYKNMLSILFFPVNYKGCWPKKNNNLSLAFVGSSRALSLN